MKNFLLALTLITLPSVVSAELNIQEGYSVEGKILSVKTAKKFSSVEGCSKLAASKSKVSGFTFDTKSQKCTLYKNVENVKANEGFVAGTK